MSQALPYYTSYAPGSKQDSELQSLQSSDAPTDPDTLSLTDTASSADLNFQQLHASSHHRKGLRRAMRCAAGANRDDLGSCRQQVLAQQQQQHTASCQYDRDLPVSNPDKFARLLSDRLQCHQQNVAAVASSRPGSSLCGGAAELLNSPWAQRIIRRGLSSSRDSNPEDILTDHLEHLDHRGQVPPALAPSSSFPGLAAPGDPATAARDAAAAAETHVHHYHYYHHFRGAGLTAGGTGSLAGGSSVGDSGFGTISSSSRCGPAPSAVSAAASAALSAANTATHRQLAQHVSHQLAAAGRCDQPRQPFMLDSSMPVMDKPNPDTTIVEARRRLEEVSLQHQQQPAAVPQLLTIGYFLCGDSVPYRHAWPGRSITLGQFKQLMAKKGSYRYFFKRRSDEFVVGGAVHEEVTEDAEVLPLWEGKVVGKIERIE